MEAGGLNLYRMAGNSAVNQVDLLGLQDPRSAECNKNCWEKWKDLSPTEQANKSCCGGELKPLYDGQYSQDQISDMFRLRPNMRPGYCGADGWVPPDMTGHTGSPPPPCVPGWIGACALIGAEVTRGSTPDTNVSGAVSPSSKFTVGAGIIAGTSQTYGSSSGGGIGVSMGAALGVGVGLSFTLSEGGFSMTLYGGYGIGAFAGAGLTYGGSL